MTKSKETDRRQRRDGAAMSLTGLMGV